METWDAIKGRTCIRSYKPDPVSEDMVKALIDMAVQAPSSGNVQNWEFVIVRDPGVKEQLVDAAMGQAIIKDAPVVIVVCVNYDLITGRYGGRGRELYSIQNAAAAIENLMLAAWDKGLGTCWVGAFSENDVVRVLAIPTNARPVAIITLGHPAGEAKKPGRRESKEVMHFEAYGKRI